MRGKIKRGDKVKILHWEMISGGRVHGTDKRKKSFFVEELLRKRSREIERMVGISLNHKPYAWSSDFYHDIVRVPLSAVIKLNAPLMEAKKELIPCSSSKKATK